MRLAISPHLLRLIALFVAVGLLNGCANIARGITEGLLSSNRSDDPWADRPICLVNAEKQSGIGQALATRDARKNEQVKVLMVHGIGEQLPGYSARLQAKLVAALDLPVIAGHFREIEMLVPPNWGLPPFEGPIGHLRIHRFRNRDETREVLFYELTWSMITAAKKRQLDFDNSYEFSFRRAPLNASLKTFFNSSIPDPLIYLGESQLYIQAAVSQALCWMTKGDWDTLPDRVTTYCDADHPNAPTQLAQDHLAVVTHSLGSRIALDSLQLIARSEARFESPNYGNLRAALRDKELPIYMLANQLPLLQMGFPTPPLVGQLDAFCRPDGARFKERYYRRLNITAFSDPNDILSYAIAPRFGDDFVDSRTCPQFNDVLVNVAAVQSLPVVGGIANPLNAHNDYEVDQRVVDLMVWGIGQPETTELVQKRCEWRERRN